MRRSRGTPKLTPQTTNLEVGSTTMGVRDELAVEPGAQPPRTLAITATTSGIKGPSQLPDALLGLTGQRVSRLLSAVRGILYVDLRRDHLHGSRLLPGAALCCRGVRAGAHAAPPRSS